MQCPKCKTEIAAGAEKCGKCGWASDATLTLTTPRSAVSAPASSITDEGRFPPGTLLNQRYRVIDILGKGGMGEVYRANDLILGQPVALKFLPVEMARDEMILARFRNEVRTARQVAHPNVCRCYDLGEVDGAPYISMEYIDGEDLSTLIKRIGRLPQDKGVELARQLCAGIAAAHDKGVLHRDLKPANILINKKGQLLITDFGLAGLAEHVQTDVRSGTPAYMAPEQLSGLEVTAKSDIYALGLVLYEIFTGKRAHEASTRAELLKLKEGNAADNLSSLVKDLDPAIERAIERCLHPDPAKRPASAIAVSAALPGGDPLAAALAAGETPTPEMVAASGSKDSISPGRALVFVGLALAGWIALSWANGHLSLLDKIPFEQPAPALAQKAKETLAKLGYAGKPVDTAYGLTRDNDYIQRLSTEFGGKAWEHLSHTRPSPVYFWYRSSPSAMSPVSNRRVNVTENDPPVATPGMRRIVLDPEGRLRSLLVIPVLHGPPAEKPFDWNAAFALAEIDPAKFTEAEPAQLPLVSFDQRGSWKGRISEMIPHDFRVEAAAYRGELVYFNVFIDWGGEPPARPALGRQLQALLNFLVLLAALVFSALYAWRNYKSGRGDRVGAARLAVAIFACANLSQFLQGRYGSVENVFGNNGVTWISISLFVAALFGAEYLALEPVIRRRWPALLVGWTRLMAGQFRDPMLGRHVLYGVAGGTTFLLLGVAIEIAEKSVRLNPVVGDLDALLGVRYQMGALFGAIDNSFNNTMLILLLVIGIAMVVRKLWVAALLAAAMLAVLGGLGASMMWLRIAVAFVGNGLVILYLLRFGMLATWILLCVTAIFETFPPDLHWGAWYADTRALAALSVLALLAYGYFTATAGHRNERPEDELS